MSPNRRFPDPPHAAAACLRRAELAVSRGLLDEAERWCDHAHEHLSRAGARKELTLEEEDALRANLEARIRAFVEQNAASEDA